MKKPSSGLGVGLWVAGGLVAMVAIYFAVGVFFLFAPNISFLPAPIFELLAAMYAGPAARLIGDIWLFFL